MLVGSLYDSLNDRFPFNRAADWDSVGLQLGSADAELGIVAVCHEVTTAVVDHCVSKSVNTLVTYHPLLFHPVTSVVEGPTAEGLALRLLHASVSLIVVHTAMDVAPEGTGDQLATALGFAVVGSFAESGDSMVGRFGILESGTTRNSIVRRVSEALGSSTRITTGPDEVVTGIAVVPGSGGSFIDEASRVADVFITGDVSHHEARQALRLGLCVIDAGHIPTERPGVKYLYDVVRSTAPDAEFVTIDTHPWRDA